MTARLMPVANHENRGRRGPFSNPTPAEIIAAREAARLTQTEAGARVRARLRSWQHWEATPGTEEHRNMPPGLFELFLIKTGQALPSWMKGDDA